MTSTSNGNGSQENIAKITWELQNNIKTMDNIYKYDFEEQRQILAEKAWEKDPYYFKDIQISALALLKMIMHARSGGSLEIMGILIGKVKDTTIIIMDCFALPVEGTETRVNAQSEAYEYMTDYILTAKMVGRPEHVIGWYHSHPGYGCWLSGIDVETQMLNQNFQDPFVAIVIDPIRTMSAGKVCLGAFRTFPKNFKPINEEKSNFQTIPLNKIIDFGVHALKYYSLEVNYFKSSLDYNLLNTLWSKHWISTLSSSIFITNYNNLTSQILDTSEKLDQVIQEISRPRHVQKPEADNKLQIVTKESNNATSEMLNGFVCLTIKESLFTSASTPLLKPSKSEIYE